MGGEFLTTGYCFSYCFLEIFVGGQGLDGGVQSREGGSHSPLPHYGKPWPAIAKAMAKTHNGPQQAYFKARKSTHPQI